MSREHTSLTSHQETQLVESDIEKSFDIRRHITSNKRKKISKQDLEHVAAFNTLVHLAKYKHMKTYKTPQIVDLFAIFAKNMQTIETVDQYIVHNSNLQDYYEHQYEAKCNEVKDLEGQLEGQLAKSTSKKNMLDLLQKAHDKALKRSTSGKKAKSTPKENMIDLLENAHDEALASEKEKRNMQDLLENARDEALKEEKIPTTLKKPDWMESEAKAHIGASKQLQHRIRAL